MAKFIIEIEEGKTECPNCPFGLKYWDEYWGEHQYRCEVGKLDIDTYCIHYDMSTIKITKQE